MGSLTSRPKAPAVVSQPVVYTLPAAASPTAASSSATDNTVADDTPDPAAQKEVARNAGLLDRRRGVLSTVVTGFRGVLNQSAAAPRKTLLGE